MPTTLIPVYQNPITQLVQELSGGGTVPESTIGKILGVPRIQTMRFNVTGVAAIAVPSNTRRRTLTVQNEGANDIYIGGEDLTPNNGWRLAAASNPFTLELAGELYAITLGTVEALQILLEVNGE